MDFNNMNDAEIFRFCRDSLNSALLGDILDEMDFYHQFLPQEIKPLDTSMICVGRAMTVQEADCTGSGSEERNKPFGLMFEALDSLKEGDIYICAGSSLSYAQWGGLMTNRAKILKAGGAVVNAYSRDTLEVLTLDFPLFSSGTYAQDQGVRGRVIDYNCPITFANGVHVEPGDLVFGDLDGVVIVPRRVETEVLRRAYEKLQGEDTVRKAILSGMSTVEVYKKYKIM